MMSVRSFFSKHKTIWSLSFLYLFLRLYHLTAIPIFNDEAIYLDWGWREIHHFDLLFYSLYDAKPPLLMWLFGITSLFAPTMLFAGRLVSVIFGYLTFIGIWKLTKKVGSTQMAVLACLLYICIPIFSFFDRQALMESAIGTIGVWSCLITLKLYETEKIRWTFMLGIVLGGGYLIKTSALVFFVPTMIFLIYDLISKKHIRGKCITNILVCGFTGFFIVLPMLLQKLYWETLPTNDRYSLKINEILSIPWSHWLKLLSDTSQILFFHLTPLPLIVLVVATIVIIFQGPRYLRYILLWFLIPLSVDVLVIREVIERYVVSYLPISLILIAFIFSHGRNTVQRTIVVTLTIGSALFITSMQIISPLRYFSFLSAVSKFALKEYTSGYTSGYGVPEVVAFLVQQISDKPAYLMTALHTGNPESGVMTYFLKNPDVVVGYFDSKTTNQTVTDLACISSPIPFYFVSRETDQAGMAGFLRQVYYKKSSISNFGIGIYTLRSPCVGKTLQFSVQHT